MTDKQARTLTQPSNRAKPKDARAKKTVFKPVLDSPFRIQWPSVPLNVQNGVLAHILKLLAGAAEYQQQRFSASRKRKRANNDRQPMKQGSRDDVVEQASGSASADVPLSLSEEDTITPPPILEHLVCGINAVTKCLEEQTQTARRPVIASIPTGEPRASGKRLKYVLVCRADIDPAILIDHLPHLIAAFNSTRPQEPIKIVSLPKGSEASLAEALGIRRVAVIGLEQQPGDQTIMELTERVPTLAASWLTQAGPQYIIPTHIKQLRTTAPKDMKHAKEIRSTEREQAKKRSRQKKLDKDAGTTKPAPL